MAVQLQVESVTKDFPGTQALRGVDLRVLPGRVHGIVGENGAGKSTLVRIIAGEMPPTSGTIVVDGQTREFRSPLDALRTGIAIVSQEGNLIPYFTGAENISLGSETRFAGVFVDQRRVLAEANELARHHFPGFGLSLDTVVSDLPPEELKLIEILRALRRDAQVLILDEPTATLQATAKAMLFDVIRHLKAQGIAVILISHFLNEILEQSDDVTIMRDGYVVGSGPAEGYDEAEVIRLMIGGTLELRQHAHTLEERPVDAAPRIETIGLGGKGFTDVSLSVQPSEVVGLAGLTGAGHRAFAEALYGVERVRTGRIVIDGREVRIGSPTRARDAGIILVPDSRMVKALFGEWTVKENLSVGHLGDVAPVAGFIRGALETKASRSVVDGLSIRTSGDDQRIEELSGGNKQKVSIGRWLFSPHRLEQYALCIFIEPTEGVDVGAKSEIHNIIADIAARNAAVLLISSDLAEIRALSHRVVVFSRGRVVARFDRDAISDEAVSTAMAEGRTVKGRA
jgi:ribose transport system ATP-binding protein